MFRKFSLEILISFVFRMSHAMCLKNAVFFGIASKHYILARLKGQYCFAGWRLLSVVVCNAAGGGRARGKVAGGTSARRRRASTVTSR